MFVLIMLYIALGILYWWLILTTVQKDVDQHKVASIPSWLLGFIALLTITLWPLFIVLGVLKAILSLIGYVMKGSGSK